jgi:hypothetical protein
MADDVLYIGIDLGTFRSVMVSSDSHEEEELTVIGTPKDAIAKNFLKRDVLFGEEALKNRLALIYSVHWKRVLSRIHPKIESTSQISLLT